MNKKDVLTVKRHMLNSLVKHDYINSASVASTALKHIFGNHRIIKLIAGVTGLNYGLLKITACDNYLNNQDIVNLKSSKSKIIGLIGCLRKSTIIEMLNTLYMTRRIFIKMAVLSI